jgi:hypothetical protein
MTMQLEATAVNGQESKTSPKPKTDDGFGSLSKYANSELLAKENSAWELTMRDKYVFRWYKYYL